MFFFSRERKRKTFFAAGPLYFGPWIVSQPPAETQKRGFTGFVNYLTTLPSREKKKKKTFAYHYYCTTCCCCFLSFFLLLSSLHSTIRTVDERGEKIDADSVRAKRNKKKRRRNIFFFSLFSLCVWSKSLFFLSFSVGFIEDEWGPVLCVLSHSSLSSSSCRVLYFPVCLRTSSQRRTSLCVCVITFPSAIFRSRTSYSSTRPVVICQLFYRHPGLLPSPLSCVLYILFCVCVSIEDVTFW